VAAAAVARVQPGRYLVLGIGNRIGIGVFLQWVVVLAAAMWRTPVDATERSA
jgi:hypothetical protein